MLFAQRAWADLSAGEKGRLKATHDVYLKQWQLSHPQLTERDVILYDEAQDADPCIASVEEGQRPAQLIAVGFGPGDLRVAGARVTSSLASRQSTVWR